MDLRQLIAAGFQPSGNRYDKTSIESWKRFGYQVKDGPAVFSWDDTRQLMWPEADTDGEFIVNESFRRCWIKK